MLNHGSQLHGVPVLLLEAERVDIVIEVPLHDVDVRDEVFGPNAREWIANHSVKLFVAVKTVHWSLLFLVLLSRVAHDEFQGILLANVLAIIRTVTHLYCNIFPIVL